MTEDEHPPRAPRPWFRLTRTAYAAVAMVVGGIVLVVTAAALLVLALRPEEPDPEDARAHVQTFYDRRTDGSVRVEECVFLSHESGFDRYRCAL